MTAVITALLLLLAAPVLAKDAEPRMLVNIDGAHCQGIQERILENDGREPLYLLGLSSWIFQAGVNLRVGGKGLEDGDRYVFFDSWQGYGLSRSRDVTFPGGGVRVAPGQRLIANAWCYGPAAVYLILFLGPGA